MSCALSVGHLNALNAPSREYSAKSSVVFFCGKRKQTNKNGHRPHDVDYFEEYFVAKQIKRALRESHRHHDFVGRTNSISRALLCVDSASVESGRNETIARRCEILHNSKFMLSSPTDSGPPCTGTLGNIDCTFD